LTIDAAVAWLFTDGHAVDVMLAVLAVEALWLVVRGRSDTLTALLPAVPILLALRVALTGGGWPWVAAWLAVSLPVHLWDLRRRLQR
jgi:hypothetical protein